jgi:hypothetical protein
MNAIMGLCMTTADWLQLGALILAAFTLWYLIKYVGYTKLIAEATSKPVVIAVRSGVITNPTRLRNIGSGPALDVEWSVSGTKNAGKISYIEPDKESDALDVNVHALEHGAVLAGTTRVVVTCSYRSISGRKTQSASNYDFNTGMFFGSTFKD